MPRQALTDSHTGNSELERHIAELGPWFHNMRLRGVQTAPAHFLGDYPQVKFERFRKALPARLDGRSVLDIGCNAGFYSFEMKRRGAERVLGIDTDERYLAQARLAAELLELDVEFQKLSIWELASLGETFDLVIFMGVLYHLRYPLLGLDLIHEYAARDLLLFQSMQRGSRRIARVEWDYEFIETEPFNQAGYPKLHFVENCYAHDQTNWWIPNGACVEAMLRSSGFAIEQHPEEEVYLCRWQAIDRLPDAPPRCFQADGTKAR